MKKRGVRFLVPNEYGSFIGQILENIDVTFYSWDIDSDEIYRVKDDQMLAGSLFSDDKERDFIISGTEFKRYIYNNIYYTIFGEFKAFRPKTHITKVNTYEDFLKSECEIVLLIVDSSYYDVYCKDTKLINIIHQNAIKHGFENITFIDENDGRTRLNVW